VSLQRLSSGLRINSAKDDAAGLAISERFTTQIRGLNQAARNANDGISLSQTSESALGEVAANLQRIRELAVQSANGTNSASDRAALDLEVQQRLSEIDRIATQTTFNGLRVLDGTFGTSQFQVGANANETISINLSQGVKTSQVGQLAKGTSTAEVSSTALSGSSTIQVGSSSAVTIGASVAGTEGATKGQGAASAYAKAEAITAAGVSGLSVTAQNNVEYTIATASGGSATDTYSLYINGTNIFSSSDLSSSSLTAQQISDAVNAQSSNTGVTASLDGSNFRLSTTDGRDIIVGQTLGAGAAGGLTAGAGGSTTVNGVVYRDGTLDTVANAATPTAGALNGGTLTLSATENIVITGDGDDMGFSSANITIAKDTTTLSSSNVQTIAAANDAIQRIDSALTQVSTLRSTFGAIQNRFESTISNLSAVAENLTASRSRIQDADFAAETASLTRSQILQQAGVSILSQANALPQLALSLLQ
jgi:flagellin